MTGVFDWFPGTDLACRRLSVMHGATPATLHKRAGWLRVRLSKSPVSHRKMYGDGEALAGFRDELDAAAQAFRLPAHTRDSVATGPSWWFIDRIQSDSVVLDGEHHLPVHYFQLGLDCRTAGVAGDIVDALLEHQEELPPSLKAQIFSGVTCLQVEVDALVGEQIEGKLAHAPDQGVHALRLGADGPYDVTHGIHQLPGQGGNAFQRFTGPSLAIAADARHLAQDGDLRHAGTDIVVQIGRDGGPHPFHVHHLCHAVAVRC